MVHAADSNGAGRRSRYGEYDYLLGRVHRWTMLDLDDLMLEIETDEGITEAERKELLDRVYAILWRRAQTEMGPPTSGKAEPRP